MKSVEHIKRELAEAQKRDELSRVQCMACEGRGWYCDTTYDRAGIDVRCGRCHGTGLPSERVDDIISAALKPFVKPIHQSPPPAETEAP